MRTYFGAESRDDADVSSTGAQKKPHCVAPHRHEIELLNTGFDEMRARAAAAWRATRPLGARRKGSSATALDALIDPIVGATGGGTRLADGADHRGGARDTSSHITVTTSTLLRARGRSQFIRGSIIA